MVSQSGLSQIKCGLPSIECNEHAIVDFTLSKSEVNGDVMIRYSSPAELPFSFEWTAVVKSDGSVSTLPLKVAKKAATAVDAEKLKAAIGNAGLPKAKVKEIGGGFWEMPSTTFNVSRPGTRLPRAAQAPLARREGVWYIIHAFKTRV